MHHFLFCAIHSSRVLTRRWIELPGCWVSPELMRINWFEFHTRANGCFLWSASKAVGLSARALICVFVLLLSLTTVAAAQSGQVESLITRPIAPRGGVLFLPLALEEGAAVRLRDVVLRDGAGRVIDSHLVWIEPDEEAQVESWTTDPRHLRVYSVKDRDTADAPRRAVLLARLPGDGSGELVLGRQRLQPIWQELPSVDYSGRGGQLGLMESPSRPDHRSPFAYWRWVLLADAYGVEPPGVEDYGAFGQLIAEHFAGLWNIGLSRLAGHDGALAGRVRDLLTRICMDEHQAFAAWPADPAAVNQLLGLLLDFDRGMADIAADIDGWVELHEKPMVWIESVSEETVQVAAVNPADRDVVARFSWEGGDVALAEQAIPIAAELPQGRLTRVQLDRPGTIDDDRPDVMLRVEVGRWAEQLMMPPTGIIALPPGLTLPPLQPPLTLARVQMDQPAPVHAERATFVQVRKREGRWEVFLECLRPGDAGGDGGNSGGQRQAPATLEEVRGREGVVLFFGGDGTGEQVSLFIPETGWHRLYAGSNDGTLQIHRQSYADRWYCRVVVPDAWLNLLFEGDLSGIGVLRTHGDSERVQYLPYPAPPWRLTPGTFAVDLTRWEDLPGVVAPASMPAHR